MKRVFFYDLYSKSWQECTKPDYADKEIEEIPVHLVFTRQEGKAPPQSVVWCPEHRTYEIVTNCQGLSLTTAAGCTLQGLFGKGFTWKDIPPPKITDLTLRWQVIWQQDKDIILLIRNTPMISWVTILDRTANTIVRIPRIRQYRTESLALRLSDVMMHPKRNCPQIPAPVAEAALSYLAASAEKEFGSRPRLPASLHSEPFADGRLRLEAFLHYPFDVNLWLLRKYFFDEHQSSKFFDPRAKDPFPRLCHLLGLTPSPFLRNWHERHPFALPMVSLLQKLGIKKEALIQPFLSLLSAPNDEKADGCRIVLKAYDYHLSLGSSFSTNIFADDEEVRMMLLLCGRGWYRPDFIRLLFYCQWYLFQTSEEKLADHLLHLLENWQPYYLNFMDTFRSHYPDIPLDMRSRIIKEGIFPDSEALIMKAVNQRKHQEPDFHYTEEQKGYSCVIDGFEFRLIYYSDEFLGLLKTAHYHYSSNSPSLKDDGMLRLGIFRQGRLVCCLMLHGIIQDICNIPGGFIHEHAMASAALRIAILHWLKWTGLYKNYGPYYESNWEILSQEVEAKPLSQKHF